MSVLFVVHRAGLLLLRLTGRACRIPGTSWV